MNMTKPVTCDECMNFDGAICDYNGLLCDKDDIPRCGMEGFIPFGTYKKGRENDASKQTDNRR